MKKKPVAIPRRGSIKTPKSTYKRLEAVSPDPTKINLKGRRTPKGKIIASEDYDESDMRTLTRAVINVFRKLKKKGHNLKVNGEIKDTEGAEDD